MWFKIEKLIFTHQFSREFENPLMKTLFVTYCFLGGFCFDERVNARFRQIWITYHVLNSVIINASCIYYYVDSVTHDFLTITLLLATMVGTFVVTVIYFWCFFSKNKLLELMHASNSKYIFHGMSTEETAPKCDTDIDTKKIVLAFCAITSLTYFILFSGNLKLLYLDYNSNGRGKYTSIYYPMYWPFESSTISRWSLRFIQLLTVIPNAIVCTAITLFHLISGSEIRNKYAHFNEDFGEYSRSALKKIDQTYQQQESLMEKKRTPGNRKMLEDLKNQRDKSIKEFRSHIGCYVRRYQQLHSCKKMFVKSAEVAFSISLTTTFGFLIGVGFIFITAVDIAKNYDLFTNAIIPVFGVLCFEFLIFFWYCYLGTLIEEMDEMIVEQIYASPWYDLSPNDRKTILIFLTICQRPFRVLAWKRYAMNLRLLPEIMNSIYSNVQILRSVYNKARRI